MRKQKIKTNKFVCLHRKERTTEVHYVCMYKSETIHRDCNGRKRGVGES